MNEGHRNRNAANRFGKWGKESEAESVEAGITQLILGHAGLCKGSLYYPKESGQQEKSFKQERHTLFCIFNRSLWRMDWERAR